MCTLVEFAITILMSQRKSVEIDADAALDSKRATQKIESSVMAQTMKLNQATNAWEPDDATIEPVPTDHFLKKLVVKIRKWLSFVALTYVIDFIAVWVYFFLFALFNYAYWNTYWSN